MKTLEVTDEQHAFIQYLREEINDQVVGKYGFVRERDAVQFLIDNLDGDLEVDGEVDAAAAVDAASQSGTDDDATITYDEDADTDDVDGDGETDLTDEANPADVETADDEEPGETADDDGSASDDDMLDRMMNLLETHDDKWEESPSADYRYRVTLPDGTTEDVQTKDDVRALLFQHY
ncbi:hypothetical protein ACFOZ7_10525 [Natribaculum luteum]|uniref:Uncharacterized protein n=1 Tax=Natribaculum luteum TaxID=1586232 RepID=A0ABD5P064_9EURY|nr:hypothetical protein [Natribaculum luteum]